MRLGIVASNISSGGGVTHLAELLREAKPNEQGFSQVIVWSGQATLNLIDDRPWLLKENKPALEKGLFFRVLWQRFTLSKLAREARCDVLWVPGGSYLGDFRPMVTMSQNMLPFEWRELRRYGLSRMFLRLLMLHKLQTHSFRRAQGLIFLTRYAHDSVFKVINRTRGQVAIIPHGIDKRFTLLPRTQSSIDHYWHLRL